MKDEEDSLMSLFKVIDSDSQMRDGFHLLKFKRLLTNIFFLIFLFAFTNIVGSIIFSNYAYDMIPAILIILIGFNITMLYCINQILNKYDEFISRYFWRIISGGLIIVLVINVIAGYMLRYEHIFDLGAIYTGASEWSATGEFMGRMNPTCDQNYFYYFPNNLGGMTLLYVAFKIASIFGATDYFAISMVTNAILAVLTLLLIVLVCKRMFGVKQGVMAMVCMMAMPALYFVAPVFYTDSLSMVFPILVIYLYFQYIDSEATSKKILFASLIGIACAVGMLVKFTVLISLIAVIVYHLLKKNFLSVIPMVAISVAIIFGIFSLFNQYFYANHLDEATAENLNTPYSHWVMMSLEGQGQYNPQDYEFTRSFNDASERSTAISNRIKERIGAKGVVGMLELFNKKAIIVFGDGTLAQSDFLDDNPVNLNSLHSLVTYDGENYKMYRYICSGVYFSLLLLMLVSAFNGFRLNRQSMELLPMLCMFGIMLFLMFWEVSSRYVTNYVPMVVILAVGGLDSMPKLKGKT